MRRSRPFCAEAPFVGPQRGFSLLLKGIDHGDTVEDHALTEILAPDFFAAPAFGGRNNHGVPDRDLETTSNLNGLVYQARVSGDDGLEAKMLDDFISNLSGRSVFQFAGQDIV